MSIFYRPACWLLGHDTYINEGRSWIKCQRCDRDTTKTQWWRKIQPWIAWRLLDSANFVDNPFGRQFPQTPNYTPRFRAIDTKHLESLGTKHSVDAYSYEGLQSLMKQEGEEYTLGQLFDESGWVEITDDNANEILELMNKSVTYEATKQEQEELNRND